MSLIAESRRGALRRGECQCTICGDCHALAALFKLAGLSATASVSTTSVTPQLLSKSGAVASDLMADAATPGEESVDAAKPKLDAMSSSMLEEALAEYSDTYEFDFYTGHLMRSLMRQSTALAIGGGVAVGGGSHVRHGSRAEHYDEGEDGADLRRRTRLKAGGGRHATVGSRLLAGESGVVSAESFNLLSDLGRDSALRSVKSLDADSRNVIDLLLKVDEPFDLDTVSYVTAVDELLERQYGTGEGVRSGGGVATDDASAKDNDVMNKLFWLGIDMRTAEEIAADGVTDDIDVDDASSSIHFDDAAQLRLRLKCKPVAESSSAAESGGAKSDELVVKKLPMGGGTSQQSQSGSSSSCESQSLATTTTTTGSSAAVGGHSSEAAAAGSSSSYERPMPGGTGFFLTSSPRTVSRQTDTIRRQFLMKTAAAREKARVKRGDAETGDERAIVALVSSSADTGAATDRWPLAEESVANATEEEEEDGNEEEEEESGELPCVFGHSATPYTSLAPVGLKSLFVSLSADESKSKQRGAVGKGGKSQSPPMDIGLSVEERIAADCDSTPSFDLDQETLGLIRRLGMDKLMLSELMAASAQADGCPHGSGTVTVEKNGDDKVQDSDARLARNWPLTRAAMKSALKKRLEGTMAGQMISSMTGILDSDDSDSGKDGSGKMKKSCAATRKAADSGVSQKKAPQKTKEELISRPIPAAKESKAEDFVVVESVVGSTAVVSSPPANDPTLVASALAARASMPKQWRPAKTAVRASNPTVASAATAGPRVAKAKTTAAVTTTTTATTTATTNSAIKSGQRVAAATGTTLATHCCANAVDQTYLVEDTFTEWISSLQFSGGTMKCANMQQAFKRQCFECGIESLADLILASNSQLHSILKMAQLSGHSRRVVYSEWNKLKKKTASGKSVIPSTPATKAAAASAIAAAAASAASASPGAAAATSAAAVGSGSVAAANVIGTTPVAATGVAAPSGGNTAMAATATTTRTQTQAQTHATTGAQVPCQQHSHESSVSMLEISRRCNALRNDGRSNMCVTLCEKLLWQFARPFLEDLDIASHSAMATSARLSLDSVMTASVAVKKKGVASGKQQHAAGNGATAEELAMCFGSEFGVKRQSEVASLEPVGAKSLGKHSAKWQATYDANMPTDDALRSMSPLRRAKAKLRAAKVARIACAASSGARVAAAGGILLTPKYKRKGDATKRRSASLSPRLSATPSSSSSSSRHCSRRLYASTSPTGFHQSATAQVSELSLEQKQKATGSMGAIGTKSRGDRVAVGSSDANEEKLQKPMSPLVPPTIDDSTSALSPALVYESEERATECKESSALRAKATTPSTCVRSLAAVSSGKMSVSATTVSDLCRTSPLLATSGLHANNVPIGVLKHTYCLALLESSQPHLALFVMQSMVDLQPDDADVHGLQALAFLQLGNLTRAKKAHCRWKALGNQGSIFGWLAEVLILKREKRNGEAMQRMDECLKLHCRDPLALSLYLSLQFGKIMAQQRLAAATSAGGGGSSRRLLEQCKQLAAKASASGMVRIKYAAALMLDYLDEHSRASDLYRDSVAPWAGAQWRQVPYPVSDALIRYALYLTRDGKFSEAQKYFEPVINSGSQSAQIHAYYAFVLAQLRRYVDAIKHLNVALQKRPDFFEARFQLASLRSLTLRSLNEANSVAAVADAEEEFEGCIGIRESGRDADAHVGYAAFLMGRQRYEEAEFHVCRALVADHSHAEALYVGGMVALSKGTYRLSEARLKKLLKVTNSEHSEGLSAMALCLHLQLRETGTGDAQSTAHIRELFEDSIEICSPAAVRNTKLMYALFLADSGEKALAIEQFVALIREDTANHSVRFLYAWFLFHCRKYETACVELAICCENCDSSFEYFRRLAECQLVMGVDNVLSEMNLKTALRLFANDKVAFIKHSVDSSKVLTQTSKDAIMKQFSELQSDGSPAVYALLQQVCDADARRKRMQYMALRSASKQTADPILGSMYPPATDLPPPKDCKVRECRCQEFNDSLVPSNTWPKYEQLRITEVDILEKMATVLSKLSKYSEAKKYALRATRLCPAHEEAIFRLATILGNLNEYSEAERYYRKVFEANPTHGRAFNNYGVMMMNAGHFAEARRLLETAEELLGSAMKKQIANNYKLLLKKRMAKAPLSAVSFATRVPLADTRSAVVATSFGRTSVKDVASLSMEVIANAAGIEEDLSEDKSLSALQSFATTDMSAIAAVRKMVTVSLSKAQVLASGGQPLADSSSLSVVPAAMAVMGTGSRESETTSVHSSSVDSSGADDDETAPRRERTLSTVDEADGVCSLFSDTDHSGTPESKLSHAAAARLLERGITLDFWKLANESTEDGASDEVRSEALMAAMHGAAEDGDGDNEDESQCSQGSECSQLFEESSSEMESTSAHSGGAVEVRDAVRKKAAAATVSLSKAYLSSSVARSGDFAAAAADVHIVWDSDEEPPGDGDAVGSVQEFMQKYFKQ